jgi:ABC-type phosphate transport system substrate-binding protein
MGKGNAVKYLKTLLLVAGLTTFTSVNAQAGSVKIIANTSVKADSISADELKSVFLEEKSSLSDGSHVEPVIEKGGAAHEAFLKEYLDKNDSALQTYYRSLVFTGKGSMPKSVGSDAEVAAFVAKTKGAIGYVSESAAAEGTKTLQVK